jgi:hypothetical protein
MLKHFAFTVVTDLKIFCLFRVPVLAGVKPGLQAGSALQIYVISGLPPDNSFGPMA